MTSTLAAREPLASEDKALIHRYFGDLRARRIRRALAVCAAIAATTFVLTLPFAHAPLHEMFLVWFVGVFVLVAGWSVVGILVAVVIIERVTIRRLERVPIEARVAIPDAIREAEESGYGERATSRSGMAAGALVAAVMAFLFGVALLGLGIANGAALVWIVIGVLFVLVVAVSFGALAGSGIVPSPARPTLASIVTFAIAVTIATIGGLAIVRADDADRIYRLVIETAEGIGLVLVGASVPIAVAWAMGARALAKDRLSELPGPRPQDTAIIELLNGRDGLATEVTLEDGRACTVYNIAWGYDSGDTHAHVTTNISPDVNGAAIDFFVTDEIVRIVDPLTGEVLVKRGS